jgi:mercuric ion transport protein
MFSDRTHPPGSTCSPSSARRSGPNPWWLVGGSAVSAITASACCVGPLVFALLGLGGAATLVKLSPLRPYLMPLTLLLLGGGLVLAYREPRLASAAPGAGLEAGCGCARPRTRAAGRVTLWALAALVLLLLVAPYLLPALVS